MSGLTWAERIAAAVSKLQIGDIPQEVLQRASLHGLDTVGVALAAAQSPAGQQLGRWAAAMGSRKEASLIGLPERASVADAAFVNAALGHALDFDDTHTPAFLHPSTVVWAAAMAFVESWPVTAADLLCAVVAGYEVLGRLGRFAAGRFNWRGFHTTSILGALAAAVVAARITRTPPSIMATAMNITATMGAGLLEGMRDGSDVKMLQVGWATRAGVVATDLARRGFVGPRLGLEGDYGAFRAHLETLPAGGDDFLNDFGAYWETVELVPKFYPSCHHIHGFMDVAKTLRDRQGFSARQLNRVVCRVAQQQVPVVCEPLAERRRPATPYAARFSLPYCVALVLTGYEGAPADFEEPRLSEESLLALSEKVDYEVAEMPAFPRLFPAHVRLCFLDGNEEEAAVSGVRGQEGHRVADGEVIDKFRMVTSFLARPRQAEILEAFLSLPAQKDVTTLMAVSAVRPEQRVRREAVE